MRHVDDVNDGAGTDPARRVAASHTEVLAGVAARLLAAGSDDLGEAIDDALVCLGEAFGADRAYVLVYDDSGHELDMTREWSREGIERVGVDLDRLPPSVRRWWGKRVLTGEPIVVRSLDDIGTNDDRAALQARAVLAADEVSALLLVPILMHGRPRGAVGFSVVARPYPFDDDAPVLVQLAGQLIVNRFERARAEDALRCATEQLERRNDELEQSNRRLEEFAYVASHDLKSPLLVVRGFLDLLDRDKGGPLPDDARSLVAAALRGASRMERLIDDLLAYSRAGARSLELDDVDLGELVGWVVDDCDTVLAAAGATVDVDPLPVVRADRTQLAQVMQNLVGNAVKFAREGVPPRIHIRAERREREWVVCVADNGIGIPLADRPKVFGMFTRLDATADRPGSGIGLAIASRVIEAHHGQLWIDDGEAGGTTFCFSLPAERSVPA